MSSNWLELGLGDAVDRLNRIDISDEIRAATRAMMDDGIAILRGWQDPGVCSAVVNDYERYVNEHRVYVDQNLDALGHEKRLVNFHLWSDNAAAIGTNPRVMRLLDFLFGLEACVYTSLTFKYGTQQPVHRDAPHFATWPRANFVGVWTALHDVNPDSGPIFYYRNAHRFHIDEGNFWEEAQRRLPSAPEDEQLLLALDLYNGEVINRAPQEGELVVTSLSAGDVVVWHPELPHGGMPATNPELTRWSIVFHCAPVAIQVYQHSDFFRRAGLEAPPARYGFTEMNGRKVARAGEVAYM